MDELKRLIIEALTFDLHHKGFKAPFNILSADYLDEASSPNNKLHQQLMNIYDITDKDKAINPHIWHRINDYSSSESAVYNGYLTSNGNRSKDLDKHIREISHFINNSYPLPFNLHVFSGMKHFNPAQVLRKTGGIIHTPAFTSTSLDPKIAALHSNDSNTESSQLKPKDAERHIIHFDLPIGYNRGRYIAAQALYPAEQEFLLDKDQKWEHNGYHRVSSRHGVRHIWSVVPYQE